VGKLTPVRPKAIRAAVSSFNFNQAGVASEINVLSGDGIGALSGDRIGALSIDATTALSGDSSGALSGTTIEALLGEAIERLDKAFPLKGQ
jgi:hypothetical protein